MNKTLTNVNNWISIYNNTNYGDKYPDSYIVGLFYREIKSRIENDNKKINVLDFGCGCGANSKIFLNAGYDVYGIDVSKKAIEYCNKKLNYDEKKFVVCDMLKDGNPFNVKFDLILASNVLYYFSQNDLNNILTIFKNILNPGGLVYADFSTFGHIYYSAYENVPKDDDGLIAVNKSGTADEQLYVRIVKDKDELRDIFYDFNEIGIYKTTSEYSDGKVEQLRYLGMVK